MGTWPSLQTAIDLAERRRLPDWLVRAGIRNLIRQRDRDLRALDCQLRNQHLRDFINANRKRSIALSPETANQQHYEVPSEFFKLILGRRLKYSCSLWNPGVKDLDSAEEAMLRVYADRARLADNMEILELGCGWGSLSLWMAEHFPSTRILALSNSRPQKEYIDIRCRELGLQNLEVVTADINDFSTKRRFDRVVSIEMFEHVTNHRQLLHRIAGWLKPQGKLFIHIFCHQSCSYRYETDGASNWMGRYFFTNGIMPSDDLLLHLQDDVLLQDQWRVDGSHYARTAQAWLRNLDAHHEEVRELFDGFYPPGEAERWIGRWRIFFMSCEELFGFRGGQCWWVSHYLFRNRC